MIRIDKTKAGRTMLMVSLATAGLMATTPVHAQNIMGPSKISVTSNIGNGWGNFPLGQMVDGNSSDAGPYNGFAGATNKTGVITLTFDQPYDLTEFHLWNDINVRAEGVQNYTLRFYDSAGNPVGADITPPNTTAGQVPAQVTGFSRAGIKKVDLIINSIRTTTGISRVEIREVAFKGSPAAKGKEQAEAYRCYDLMRHNAETKSQRFNMVDQFGQSRTMVGHPVQLCNPVALNQRGATPQSMAKRYKDHLVCYELFDMDARGQNQQNVVIRNRMETNRMVTGHADQVCLVSSKRHLKAPPPPPDSPGPRRAPDRSRR